VILFALERFKNIVAVVFGTSNEDLTSYATGEKLPNFYDSLYKADIDMLIREEYNFRKAFVSYKFFQLFVGLP
jgi:hypothetical protein